MVNCIFISHISTWILAVQWPFRCVMMLNFVLQEDASWNLETRLKYYDFEMFQIDKSSGFCGDCAQSPLVYFFILYSISIPYHTTEPSTTRGEFFFRGCNKFLIYGLTVAEIMQYLKYLLPGERSRGEILVDRSWTNLGLLNVIYGDVMSNTIIIKAKTVAW